MDIIDRDGQWVGRGFYNGHSRIALRVLTTNADEPIDDAFFARRLGRAVELRRDWLGLDAVTDAYRLVHSEGDGLSGLVVDRFGPVVVLEFFSAGMYRFREAIQTALSSHYPDARFYWFAEEHVQKQESFDCRPPEPPPPEVDHGARRPLSRRPGQQAQDRLLPRSARQSQDCWPAFCAGKRVLDLCCNTGGFAVYAKALGRRRGGDRRRSGRAGHRPGPAERRPEPGAASASCRPTCSPGCATIDRPPGQRFDVVVLDPAKQTRDREEVDYALKRYLDMNRLALQAVAPGGIFLTCSCTGLVSEDDFLETLRRAAWQAGRDVQVLRISGAGADHPYLLHVPEGRYLKAVFCRVE